MENQTANTTFKLAVDFINQTARHVFLTGKAGTGKTTFLKYIRQNSYKKMAVAAPTGVAAINAGGVTLHSLLQLPFGSYLPTKQSIWNQYQGQFHNEHTLFKNLRLSNNKRTVLKELELLIIDEVSMVRCDYLDAADTILRHVRRQHHLPFGGVQLLYIGDLFQLPPVVKNEEWNVLKDFYRSPFFFDAQVIQQAPPVIIELSHIYRQSDDAFIHLLNKVRNNEANENDLAVLQQFYNPSFKPQQSERYITLTTHNTKADTININQLAELHTAGLKAEAVIEGDFPDYSFPAEQILHLKEGAQIMFIKNDKGEERKFYNGKIGIIKKIEDDKVYVSCEGDETLLELTKETWRNIRYNYNKEADEIEEEELGTFTQYPVRLAWAITIHKSQGLTFEKAVIDCGAAFAPGQVYVALSRLTSLNGLVLKSLVQSHSIKTDERVLAFMQQTPQENDLHSLLDKEKQAYASYSFLSGFDFNRLIEKLEEFDASYDHRKLKNIEIAKAWCVDMLKNAEDIQAVAQKFQKQLQQLFIQNDQSVIYKRAEAASSHFIQQINDRLLYPLDEHIKYAQKNERVKKYLTDLSDLKIQIERRKLQLQHILNLTSNTAQEIDLSTVVEQIKKPVVVPHQNTEKKKREKGDSYKLSLALFRQGKTIEEIAKERNLAKSTIEGHIANFIATGEVAVEEIVSTEKIKKIMKVLDQLPENTSSSAIKEQLDETFSYGEIKAVIKHKEFLQNKTVLNG